MTIFFCEFFICYQKIPLFHLLENIDVHLKILASDPAHWLYCKDHKTASDSLSTLSKFWAETEIFDDQTASVPDLVRIWYLQFFKSIVDIQ